MIDESVPQDLRLEAAVVLGSLAWGTEENIYHLVNAGAVPVLLRGINQFNDFIGIQYCILWFCYWVEYEVWGRFSKDRPTKTTHTKCSL